MDRYWLMTWTTYGTWLPGDERGFVSDMRENGVKFRVDELDSKPMEKIRGLQIHSREQLKSDPIFITIDHARLLLDQFHETANHRDSVLLAIAIMANHMHVLLGAPGDPDPEDILRDLKAYGSRKLNRQFGKPKSGTWWTESGSKRKKDTDEKLRDAYYYVLNQEFPLLIWDSGKLDEHILLK